MPQISAARAVSLCKRRSAGLKNRTDNVVPLVEADEGLPEASRSTRALITPFESNSQSPVIDNDTLKALVHNMANQIDVVEKRLERVEWHVRKSRGYPDAIIKQLASGVSPIKVLRKHRGKTQKELANMAGCSTAYISQLEQRNRFGSMKMLRCLAGLLDVDVYELIEN